jgi:hypothetical protein
MLRGSWDPGDIIEELFIAQMVPQTNKVHKYFNFLATVNGRIEA